MENRTLHGEEDGLPMNEDVGSWSFDKYRVFQLYAHLFTKGMKGKWFSLTYVDLYAGAGFSRVKDSDEILLGSPLISLSIDVPFDRYIFCEKNPDKLAALKQRVANRSPTAEVYFVQGDCNDPGFQLSHLIPQKSLTLCFVDPYDIGLRFQTIQSLSKDRSIDFLCLIASRTDAGRNLHNYSKEESTKIDQLLGTKDWRDRWENLRKSSARSPNFGDFVLVEFAKRMESLNYLPTPVHEMKPIKRDDDLTLYHLALFARHDTAKRFWKEATKYSNDQRELF